MNHRTRSSPRGFTLLEILIVLALVAVLATVVILVLNPADILRQTRDSQRISDIKTLSKAIELYLANSQSFGTAATCYAHASSTATTCAEMNFTGGTSVQTVSSRANDGTGWLPLNFAALDAGSPFATLPIDPKNNATHFYAFRSGSSSTYKLNARMESAKYSAGGDRDVESKDGGTDSAVYEVGSDLTL